MTDRIRHIHRSDDTQIFLCPHCHANLHEAVSRASGERGAACERGHFIPRRGGILRFQAPPPGLDAGPLRRYGLYLLDSYRGTRIAREELRRLTGWLPEQLAGQRVVILGALGGRHAEWLARYTRELVLFEPDERIEICRDLLGDLPGVRYAQANPRRLPLATGWADALLLVGTLATTADPQGVFDEARRVVRVGGDIAIAFPLGELPDRRPVRWMRRLAGRFSLPAIEAWLRGFHTMRYPGPRRSDAEERQRRLAHNMLADLLLLRAPTLTSAAEVLRVLRAELDRETIVYHRASPPAVRIRMGRPPPPRVLTLPIEAEPSTTMKT